jgi:outer membrane protein TolC
MKTIRIEDRGLRIEERLRVMTNDRETTGSLILTLRYSIILILALCALIVPRAFAQARVGPPPQSGSQAAPLPLSGRNPQAGSVTATETAVPGTTTSVNTINPTIQVQGPYSGSASSTGRLSFSGKLSLQEAVARAVDYNLGAIGLSQAVRQSRGQARVARSVLLPNLNANLSENVQQLNLATVGLRFNSPLPSFSVPSVVGPYNFFDLRATLSQTVLDITALNNYRSAKEVSRANEYSAEDARDLVVLAVAGAYVQVIASKARVDSARAQLETANTLFKQTSDQRSVGLVAQVDVNRSQVQALTQQQRLLSLQNDLAKQKINLARLTGLPPSDTYDISDDVPYSPAPAITVEAAIREALEQRSDLKAAEAQVRAAERARSAARAERLPSISVSADYGVIGTNPSQSHGTFTLVGTIRVPIWQGGRTEGNIEQAEAALIERRAELEDVKARIESEVRNAYSDLQAATNQVDLALKNVAVSQQNLDLTRQRFEAGVSDNLEVVQSQESIATARLDYINGVFAHNLAKLTLARAIGRVAESLPQFLKMK